MGLPPVIPDPVRGFLPEPVHIYREELWMNGGVADTRRMWGCDDGEPGLQARNRFGLTPRAWDAGSGMRAVCHSLAVGWR